MINPKLKSLIESFLPKLQDPDLMKLNLGINNCIVQRYKYAYGPAPVYLGTAIADPRDSGTRWKVKFDYSGRNIPDNYSKIEVEREIGYSESRNGDWIGGYWYFWMSYRAPFFTIQCNPFQENFPTPNPPVEEAYIFAKEIASKFGLLYISYEDLNAWNVEPKSMTEEMWMRMDSTDDPTPFQLLFSEY